MPHGLEYWVIDKRVEKKLRVTDMRVLKWRSGLIRNDKVNYKRIKGSR